MKIRLSRKEALLYAATCDLYADGDEKPFLEVVDGHDPMMVCKSGAYTIYYGYQTVDKFDCSLPDRMRKAGA